MQKSGAIKPMFLNMDTALEELKSDESPYIKNVTWDINGNPNNGLGTGNSTESGQNMFALTPVQSNEKVVAPILPGGYNKCIGSFESKTTQEEYYFNFNGSSQHGIYVIDGNSGVVSQVIVDPKLEFSDDPKAFIANHRVTLRVTYDKDKNPVEKHLILTDGNSWQKWVNVIAAIKTNGFDASLFPYWRLQPPHFDRRELLELATRPPMVAPQLRTLPNTTEDKGKVNAIVDKAFQFGYSRQYTDGRNTAVSPYSLPLIVNSTEYLSNPDNIPKRAELVLDAGSCMVEKINIYIREAIVDATNNLSTIIWGDWHQYDTINKFDDCGGNDSLLIGNDYWKRINPWEQYNYDPIFNTIIYVFDNSKVSSIVDQNTVSRLFNDVPIRSVAQSDLGDGLVYGNNEFGYDNLSCEVMSRMEAVSVETSSGQCSIPLRNVRLYCYVGCQRGNSSGTYLEPNGGIWLSQVGYYDGEDTQMRFGNIFQRSTGFGGLDVKPEYSRELQLDFADRDSFRCYLKGTPYVADGKWFVSDSSYNLQEISAKLNVTNQADKDFITNVYSSGKFFVGVFDFTVPAGRYIATLGRHNVANSNDYRGQSTYICGIANSRMSEVVIYPNPFPLGARVIKPYGALVTTSKEMEVDCTSGNFDAWGNGRDLFYVYAPTPGVDTKWSFIEGYLYESKDGNDFLNPVEQFPYEIVNSSTGPNGRTGSQTDKNGFFFIYVAGYNNQADADVSFTGRLNCVYPKNFIFNRSGNNQSWWSRDNKIAIQNFNGGVFGDCNRVLVKGRITDLTGEVGYSSISVSIVNGGTVSTDGDGYFTLIVHNGSFNNRVDNIYVNANGSFNITLSDCGYIPITQYSEFNVPCNNCTVRNYPSEINFNVNIVSDNFRSTKEGGKYSIGVVGGDLAGRLQFVNIINEVTVPSFLERDNMSPTSIRININSPLQINKLQPEIKWLMPYVSKNTAIKKYVQWVGDKIEYIDSNGNSTNSPTNAIFSKIFIQSLYDFNVNNNFSVLAKYQFLKGDRVRILDDGDSNLFTVDQYGDPIDIQILGTNYNQAAINAGLLIPEVNTVLNGNDTDNTDIGLIVKYDSRLDRLQNKTGFWIEIYTPSQISDVVPYYEANGFFPIIDGTVQRFEGYDDLNNPIYVPISSIDVEFWDTYLINRNISISSVGSKAFNHPFESPNVTDSFGSNLISGGRINTKNDNARRRWIRQETIKSDVFVEDGIINGLGTFRSENKKSYADYKWGGIVAIHAERNLIAFICENDFFTTDFNFHYAYPDAQGRIVTNLNGGLSEAHQKVGSNYGCSYEHTSTILNDDKFMFWLDAKNTAFIKMNYASAIDISQQVGSEHGGIQSYLNSKIKFVSDWNDSHPISMQFDIVSGIDVELGNLYLTFRPRRNNSNSQKSYVNLRRGIDLKHQETLMYNIQYAGWCRFVGFTPEAYGKLKGSNANVEMHSFAGGVPYKHNNVSPSSFLNFYGIETERVIECIFNTSDSQDKSIVKVYLGISHDTIGSQWYVDLVYDNEKNSYSYIPSNLIQQKEQNAYAALLRDMSTYPPMNPEEIFRSMLLDGKRLFGNYIVLRLIGLGNTYSHLKNIYYTYTQSPSSIKK